MDTAFENSLAYARKCDEQDPLRDYRKRFYLPKGKDERELIYLCGNSLGLQPRTVKDALLRELEHWRKEAVEGHFRGEMPWMYYHKFLQPQTARLVGAREEEVVVMNTLTTNLHLMMVSFYRPEGKRNKILVEGGAFPSDQYAVESQLKFHGIDPSEGLVELQPREGEHCLRMEDILETIASLGEELALVMLGGVNYYTGQFFDLEAITRAAHAVGAMAGFDLAHAVGNVPLRLHDWEVDFAVWCSYKYLNAGPGGPSGVFVHERYAYAPDLPRFAGWWGYEEETRFLMQKGFKPMRGAAGWQLSNAQIFGFAAHKAGLDIFDEVGMDALRQKSLRLTAYLRYLLDELNEREQRFEIITPKEPEQHGCQLSLLSLHEGKALYEKLSRQGIVCDWREPNVIRVAPVPLYNSFEEVWRFAQALT